MAINTHFGLKLKQLVEEKNLTQKAAADMFGYTLPGFTKLFSKEDLGTDVLKKACQVFGTDMTYFITNTSNNISQSGTGNATFIGANNSYSTNQREQEYQSLKLENESLKEQILLLKKIITMYEKGH